MALSPTALAIAYLGVGAIGAGVVLRRGHAEGRARRRLDGVASAMAMVVLWPLWAPFALASRPTLPDDDPLVARIADALAIDGAFDGDERARIEREVTRAASRLRELERLLERARAEQEGRALSSLHHAARRRLEAAQARDRGNLEALAELVELLGAELVLARHGSGADTDDLVAALWARVEMLHDVEA